MTRRLTTRAPSALAVAAALALLAPAPAARAQATSDPDARGPSVLDRVNGTAGATYQRWTFGTPVEQGTQRVTGASQVVLPFTVRVARGERWAFDASGALTRGEALFAGGGSALLAGPTDVRLRATGRLRGDHLLLTLGLNLPTGRVGLDVDELSALQVVGAPALAFAAPALGMGLGATAGIVAAAEGPGGWAYAAGASVERRTTYTAAELSVADVRTPADVRPGQALHLSLGADRVIGAGRLALFAVGDLFGGDEIRVRTTGYAYERSRYRLGPTLTVGARAELAVPRFQRVTATVTDRFRAKFEDADGNAVDGSNGNALELALAGVLGAPDARAVVLGLHGRLDTGLAVDDRLVTAAARLVGASVGVAIPWRGLTATPTLRASVGSLDLGPASTSARELSLGLTIDAR